MTISTYYKTPLIRMLKRIVPNVFKEAIIKILNNKLFILLIKKRGKTIYGAKYNFSIVPDEIIINIFMGVWESAEIYMANKYLQNEEFIIECGSSIGVLASSFLSRDFIGTYVAIEANPNSYSILKRQINSSSSKCINLAISYPESTIEFNASSILGGRVHSSCDQTEKSNVICMQGMPLSRIIDINFPVFNQNFSLILDIEGMEPYIFKYDADFIRKAKFIICELENTSDYSIESQVEMLRVLSFEIIERYDNVFAFKNKSSVS